MHLKRMLYSTTLAAMLLSGTTALADMPRYVFSSWATASSPPRPRATRPT